MMKKILYIVFSFAFLLRVTAPAMAQPGDRKEKIEAFKVAFITQRLGLGTREAQAFWPLYNEYLDKLEAARSLRSADLKNNRLNLEALSDKEASQLLSNELLAKEKETQVTREYYEKFKTVLSLKKTLMLYKAEDDFKRELLKQLSGK